MIQRKSGPCRGCKTHVDSFKHRSLLCDACWQSVPGRRRKFRSGHSRGKLQLVPRIITPSPITKNKMLAESMAPVCVGDLAA
jgi:hypothetical protein